MKKKLPPHASKMLKYRLTFSIFFKTKMKTVRSLRKFCKNQEFSGKSVCRIKMLPLPKKKLISTKKKKKTDIWIPAPLIT